MDINLDINFLKQFEFATVKYNGQEYLKIYNYPDQLSEMTQIPISEFEIKLERELIHLKLTFKHCFNLFVRETNNVITSINKGIIPLEKGKDKLFQDMKNILDENNLEFILITNQVGEYTFFLFEDFFQELLRRIEEIDNLFSIIKPYQNTNDNNLIDCSLLEEEIDKLNILTPIDWRNIVCKPLDQDDIIQSNIIHLNTSHAQFTHTSSNDTNITFEEAIKPEAREEFEKWYNIFCMDEPDTKVIDIILFFKIMKRKGYFYDKLKTGEKINIDSFHQVALDKTKRNIAYNTFKNNGASLFEDYLFGKPIIPKFE
jgi:hypothetical protein